jgi:hypothetical protein
MCTRSGARFPQSEDCRGIPQRHAQFPDGVVQADIELYEGVTGPEFFFQFFPGNDHALPLQQQQKELERLVLQPDPKTALSQLAAVEVGFENTEARNPVPCSRFHGPSSEAFNAIILPTTGQVRQ